ncbi:MAG: ECF transporter S component [Clostridia bacterium]|nr:ECF transporter S component [Clostridia bacterium]
MNKKIRFITRTAILLALAIVFQMLGRYIPLGPNSQFVVGPLINACLMVAAAMVGLSGGGIVALLSPFGAILTGAAIPLPFAPFVALGNFLLVLLFFLFMYRSKILGLTLGALAKSVWLFAAIKIFVWAMDMKGKKAEMLLWSFSWPQAITALVGGVLALLLIKVLDKNIQK